MILKSMMRLILTLGLFVMFWGGEARAQSCTFSATGVNFGAVDVLGSSPKDAAGNIAISCTAFLDLLSSIDMRIHLGDGSGGVSGSLRRMTGTATGLNYDLYQNAGRTTVFGGTYGTHGGSSLQLTGSGVLSLLTTTGVNVPIYGRVPAGQNTALPGNYLSSFTRNPLDVRVDYRTCSLLLICTNRTASFSFNVQALVSANCRVVADDLNFGTTGFLDQAVNGASAMRVTCTSGSSYQVGIGYGLHGTNVNDRHMQSLTGRRIAYQLYRNSGRSQTWGLLADGLTAAGTGTGATQNYTIFGRVPAQTTPPPGTYADTVVVTVTY
ncbi:Csu type fimbrial protein [Paracoccus laeviglucosivorans]|uniref:Spore coat protein U (SCPU) domain-containing protein n=1 Tax=Paracoccus laeviglucosivorans TaxID=1197861 RepID=A0A521B9W1_9RHOB|nr:spore coat U domain-containing protein [Paracoccus laeviglucosivorans]SMO43490.1 Spore coat protein U (SCPU) domain-containing protein [Paracoccus laeviglucosivorans]